jgi:hypothetical protein
MARRLEHARHGRVCWPDVLRVVQGDETRSYALTRFRHSGFDADSFARLIAARVAAVDALTRTEDWLESKGPRTERERLAIRDVRRRLEVELWP